VARADAGTVVTMEVFVEQQVIPPVRIVLEFLAPPKHRPPPGFALALRFLTSATSAPKASSKFRDSRESNAA